MVSNEVSLLPRMLQGFVIAKLASKLLYARKGIRLTYC